MPKLITIAVEFCPNNMGINELVYLKTTDRYLRLKRDAKVGDRVIKGVVDDDARRGSQDYSLADRVES